ncbi:phosphotransferase [Demequina oxidasica]|uniref:phosphotransferase n=1 Tax=Demequina oxidasica TaxID=676199 RepID=UPI0007864E59|nr:phosphotransferase [Demequina oxidasica]
MSEHEVELTGGNVNGAVVRVGDTVRRAASPQSATVQRLLTHVRERGVTWVPEPLGFDGRGREVLGFIEGEVAGGEADFRGDAAVLTSVARALRQWHDATASFPRRATDVWIEHDPVPAATFMAAYGEVPLTSVLHVTGARLESMARWCTHQDSPDHQAWGHMYTAHARWMGTIATPNAP